MIINSPPDTPSENPGSRIIFYSSEPPPHLLFSRSRVILQPVASAIVTVDGSLNVTLGKPMSDASIPPKPYLLLSGEGVAGFDASVKAAKGSTGGSFTLIESHTRGGAPWHVHSREDEYLYVVSGVLTVSVGKEVFRAEQGSFVFLPRGVAHAWDLASPEKATVLMMTVPAMLEEFLREFHAASGKEARDAVSAKYGIQFLSGPPSCHPR